MRLMEVKKGLFLLLTVVFLIIFSFRQPETLHLKGDKIRLEAYNLSFSYLTRRIKNPISELPQISQALHFISDDIADSWLMNLIAEGLRAGNKISPRARKNIAKIKSVLEEHKTEKGYMLPIEIDDLQIDAGHKTYYKVSIWITEKGYIGCSVYGDLDSDYSCWNRAKVIRGTVIALLVMSGCKIIKIPPPIEHPEYGYSYYLELRGE